MNIEHLPTQVDPIRFAENATCLQGTLLVKNMPRLCSLLGNDEGTVEVKLEFGKDEQRRPFLKGELIANIVLSCQRCMEPYTFEIKDRFLAGMVSTEEKAKALSDRYEPLLIKEGVLVISDVIEDELILRLPLVPMHEPNVCNVKLPRAVLQAEDDSPFKVIEILKGKTK